MQLVRADLPPDVHVRGTSLMNPRDGSDPTLVYWLEGTRDAASTRPDTDSPPEPQQVRRKRPAARHPRERNEPMNGRTLVLTMALAFCVAGMPPAGDPDSVRVFRAARNFYYLNLIRWAIGQSATLFVVVFVFALGFMVQLGPATVPFRIIKAVVLVIFLIQLPISYLLIRFDYEMRWYIVTDRSLRIRQGLIYVREMTMTFANIQQITIQQGPLQRLLGIADLQVRTAGGGAESSGHYGGGHGTSGRSMHLGYFRGVQNAAEIRDLMLERLRQWRDTGLGDPDEASTSGAPSQHRFGFSQAPLEAAQRILTEAKALRKSVG
jgi:membrane protein YdbS with pleckstrin-like domain